MNSVKIQFKRILIPENINTFFLWGPRKSGKSTLLKKLFSKNAYYDFLDTDQFFRFQKRPAMLREEILSLSPKQLEIPIVIDEVQKIPAILDEVQLMIENHHLNFILCGSSARKLKKLKANLLGGRAWRYTLHPLVYKEIPNFDIIKALNYGLIPSHYLSSNYQMSLEGYVTDYLQEEIKEEGLTRNLSAFSRFLDAVSFTNCELVNYTNIAKDCGVDAKTVKEYFQILLDTYLGYLIAPFNKKVSRNIITTTPKFYLFDCGVANFLSKRTIQILKGFEAGKAFEHFILMELIAYRDYCDRKLEINYWRTNSGIEVDFILNRKLPVEVKIATNIDKSDLKGVIAFLDEYDHNYGIVVCNDQKKRHMEISNKKYIDIIPWQDFLGDLWKGKIHL